MKERLTLFKNVIMKNKALTAVCAAVAVMVMVLSANALAAPNRYIGVEKAKSIALEHAGISEQDVVFIRARLDREDRRDVYDVEFYSGNTEYDYEIDAISGEIIEFDSEVESYRVPAAPGIQDESQYIGEAKAKSIALEHAGISEQEAVFIKTRLDRGGRRDVYDIEFYSGNTEYDYEIDAISGDIIEFDSETKRRKIPAVSSQSAAPAGTYAQDAGQYIGEAEAESIALSTAGISESEIRKMKVKLDREDGTMVYEVDFKSGRMDYEYEIDAVSGKILKSDVEYDD
jgi:uncharacterized membrane protein YkoI